MSIYLLFCSQNESLFSASTLQILKTEWKCKNWMYCCQYLVTWWYIYLFLNLLNYEGCLSFFKMQSTESRCLLPWIILLVCGCLSYSDIKKTTAKRDSSDLKFSAWIKFSISWAKQFIVITNLKTFSHIFN